MQHGSKLLISGGLKKNKNMKATSLSLCLLNISELVLAEASGGNAEAAERRLKSLENIPELPIDEEMGEFAQYLMSGGGIPPSSEADALHVAIAAIHRIDFLLTWNCRHINNAATKPIIRKLCEQAGYAFPEICTPLELMSEDFSDV